MSTSSFFDLIKRRTVVALFSNSHLRSTLVLKGGNLLDIVFQVSERSSVDLDFSIEGEFEDLEQIRSECEAALKPVFEEESYIVFDVHAKELPPKVSADLKDFWGGYRIGFKLATLETHAQHGANLEVLRRNAVHFAEMNSTIFKIDISKFEFCTGKQSFQLDGQDIFGYSPEMVIAEKLRAICQQMPGYREFVHKNLAGRARDFLDIHTLREAYLINVENEAFGTLVKNVFEAKRVPLNLLGKIQAHSEDHLADFVAVQATVSSALDLKDFDFYVAYVVKMCDGLKSLWNE
jgi:predicted nucleotidyltransferase component of viral defense system